jgi:hypothetical protein
MYLTIIFFFFKYRLLVPYDLICPCFIVTMSHACVYTLFERSYSFDLWRIVLNVFSFPTLLARATYMSYDGGGGGGGRSKKD